MPKRAIRIPALLPGRRVRWMFEVSAVAGEGVVHKQKSSKNRVRSKRRKKSMTQVPLPVSPTPGRAMFAMAVIGVAVVGVATVALTGYPSPGVASAGRNTSAVETTRTEAIDQPVPAAPVRAVVTPARVPKATPKPKAAPVVETSSSEADPVPSRWAAALAARSAAPAAVDAVAPQPSADASAIAATTDTVGRPTTITGCLETTADEGEFRLSDVEGTDTPRARSWRSGFLKKRSVPVELVELSNAPALRNHVGQRVVATGLLANRQLRVRSVQPAGSPCD
jgi:hypothetical protein